jgi:glucodextranase-like protein/PASTA domain-containing protein
VERSLAALGALLVLVAISGCGGEQKRPAPPVRLSVDAPADMALLHDASVEVHGVVSPSNARVTVEGHDVSVSGGRFSAQVSLQPGTNLIDVLAGAKGGARPAMVALRVRRQVSVKVPDLVGFTPSDAKDALASLGLDADVQESHGLLDFLLPEDARVCQTDPSAGSQVDPGTTVTVVAAKTC